MLTSAEDATVSVANFVVNNRPQGASTSTNEGIDIIWEPLVVQDNGGIPNHGTASSSIVASCSGANNNGNACWKVADGVHEFTTFSQGWDASENQAWIVFDLQDAGKTKMTGLLVDGVTKGDDEHYPAHNPKAMQLSISTTASGPWKVVTNMTALAGSLCNLSDATLRLRFLETFTVLF